VVEYIYSESDIPDAEVWLYENAEAFNAVQIGLKEAREEKISKDNLNDL